MTVGIVVIGRNEGERLRLCLASLSGNGQRIVYVDSGSTDGSVDLARSMGAEVIQLDMTQPFTAARARNQGFAQLAGLNLGTSSGKSEIPPPHYVQFVDGDCEIRPGWIARAVAELQASADVAVVCGRLRERHPESSIYNRLCDMEWETPAGDVASCGGIAMMRVSAFQEAGGFNAALAAGEEPELCLRLRGKNWKIRRLKDEMALHDADMHHFSQWWRRCVRAGYGFAEGAAMHRRSPAGLYVRQSRSVWLWGLVIPLAALLLVWPTWGLSLLLFLLYPVQVARVAVARHRLRPDDAAWLYALFCVLAKWPQLQGQVRFYRTMRLCPSPPLSGRERVAGTPAG